MALRAVFTLILLVISIATFARPDPVSDTPFRQEYRSFLSEGLSGRAREIRSIAVDKDDRVFVATADGAFQLSENGRWQAISPDKLIGPTYAIGVGREDHLWIGAWDGLYQSDRKGGFRKSSAIDSPITCLSFSGESGWAMGPRGLWKLEKGAWIPKQINLPHSPRSILGTEGGVLWVATDRGLFRVQRDEVTHWYRKGDQILSSEVSSIEEDDQGFIWAGSSAGIDILTPEGIRVRSLTPDQGLPFSRVTSLAHHPRGVMWIGTEGGAVRYEDQKWSLRHSKRWLPSDDVHDVAFDSNGFAWIATGEGVSVIKHKMMTLAEKAEYFHDIVLERKTRDPGYVANTRLLASGDISTSTFEDDDNDGEYTNHYLAMEAFRYRVTGDPVAKELAQKAFDAMEFLQTVTETPGFIARSTVPVAWIDDPHDVNPHRPHDPNRIYDEIERAEALVEDPRYKPVEERWRLTSDKTLYWKGDTSSDEITGHFFGYFHYHMLIAETEEERKQVRDLVRRVIDYLIDGGFNLQDTDGTHTRWGVWAPDRLFGDLDWSAETPINCAELLSYLKTAYAVTGDEKYDRVYKELAEEKGYLEMARAPMPNDPALWTHIDASLLTLTLHALLLSETDPEYLKTYREGVRQWHDEVEDEYCPLFSFSAGAIADIDIDSEACVEFLRDAPLDLIEWTVDNSKREDIDLVRSPELDHWQTDRLLPASERAVMRWDRNPWTAVRGDGGRVESSGVYWLLPYWMGRYYGFIGAAE